MTFILGLDLGQSQDYTAIAIIEKLDRDKVYRVRRLERARGTPYPEVVSRVKTILQKLPGAALVVDATGVGAPVVDMFDQARLKPVGIYIHGGDKASHDSRGWKVPKRDLVGCLQVLLQNQRLKIAPGPLSDILASEMLNFKVKIDPTTAHDSYSAWREADHDDLVLAVALACWYGENVQKPMQPVAFYGGSSSGPSQRSDPRTSDPYSSAYSLTRTPRPNFGSSN